MGKIIRRLRRWPQKERRWFGRGEIGFYYGHSSGKFGGDEFGSYITGGVGNEHMQINVAHRIRNSTVGFRTGVLEAGTN